MAAMRMPYPHLISGHGGSGIEQSQIPLSNTASQHVYTPTLPYQTGAHNTITNTYNTAHNSMQSGVYFQYQQAYSNNYYVPEPERSNTFMPEQQQSRNSSTYPLMSPQDGYTSYGERDHVTSGHPMQIWSTQGLPMPPMSGSTGSMHQASAYSTHTLEHHAAGRPNQMHGGNASFQASAHMDMRATSASMPFPSTQELQPPEPQRRDALIGDNTYVPESIFSNISPQQPAEVLLAASKFASAKTVVEYWRQNHPFMRGSKEDPIPWNLPPAFVPVGWYLQMFNVWFSDLPQPSDEDKDIL